MGEYNYKEVQAMDVIQRIRPLIEQNRFQLREDMRIVPTRQIPDPNTPWIPTNPEQHRKCKLWHDVYFEYFNFIPLTCFANCWKVVVRPKTIKQLFALYDFQKKIGWPSKCGIETRPYVGGPYGGYFYNISAEQGLQTKEFLIEEFWKDPVLKTIFDISSDDPEPIILKRACTEYERKFGPSDKWVYTKQHEELERMLDGIFVQDSLYYLQIDHVRANIIWRWMRWAWKVGDWTVKEFNDGESLEPGVVTYSFPEIEESCVACDDVVQKEIPEIKYEYYGEDIEPMNVPSALSREGISDVLENVVDRLKDEFKRDPWEEQPLERELHDLEYISEKVRKYIKGY